MMYVRTAYFEGDLTDEQKQEFQEYMTSTVAPIIRTFPGCQGVQINYPDELEPAAPQQSLLMIQHAYESKAALAAALDSEERVKSMNATMKIVEKFDIKVFHINFNREAMA